jgi:hypothetical protein
MLSRVCLHPQNSLLEMGAPNEHQQAVSPRRWPIPTASVASPGLQNNTAENNCFLNVLIQCLWHCSMFATLVLQYASELGEGGHVARALLHIFHQFAVDVEAAEAAVAAAAGKAVVTRARSVVTAACLGEALLRLKKKDLHAGKALPPPHALCNGRVCTLFQPFRLL